MQARRLPLPPRLPRTDIHHEPTELNSPVAASACVLARICEQKKPDRRTGIEILRGALRRRARSSRRGP